MSKRVLEVPPDSHDNICMMNKEDEVTWNDFSNAIDKLNKLEYGHDVICWLRRRTSAHYEHTHEGYEELGSSDVTCHMFELWKQWCHSGRNPRRIINDGFGFWINAEIIQIIDPMFADSTVDTLSKHLSVENGY